MVAVARPVIFGKREVLFKIKQKTIEYFLVVLLIFKGLRIEKEPELANMGLIKNYTNLVRRSDAPALNLARGGCHH